MEVRVILNGATRWGRNGWWPGVVVERALQGRDHLPVNRTTAVAELSSRRSAHDVQRGWRGPLHIPSQEPSFARSASSSPGYARM
jgi:hypothetical protein